MNRSLPWILSVVLLGTISPASAGASRPKVVLARGGTGSFLPPPLAPAGARGGSEAAEEEERPDLRPFPHDLGATGAGAGRSVRPFPRTAEAASAPAAAATDTLRLAILRVDFLQDSAGSATTGDGRFDLRRGTGIPVDPPPHDRAYFAAHAEALARYYSAQSYGSLHIAATVFPAEEEGAYHLEDTADYGPWDVSQDEVVAAAAERFCTDALTVADASGDVDFSSFGAFVVVHAGADFQGDINRDSNLDIPSFTLTFADSVVLSTGKVGRVLVLPETSSQDGRLAALNGVFAHEFGHVLGLPDLYNIFNGIPQVGYWSLMDSGENIGVVVVDPETEDEILVDGVFPTSLDPWSRWQLFPDAVQLALPGESWSSSLEAVEVNPTLPLIAMDGPEYFLIENRALDLDGNGFPFVMQDSTGVFLGPTDDPDLPGQGGMLEYDAVLPGGGLLIWHIDEKIIYDGLATTGAVNYWTFERGVAVEEADGISDQGRFGYGDWEDLYCTPGPGDGCFNGHFGPDTVPGSETNDGAWTGITIDVASPPGRIMDVTVTRPLAVDGWPLRFLDDPDLVVNPGPLQLVDLDGDGGAEILYTFEAGLPAAPADAYGWGAVRADGTPFPVPGGAPLAAPVPAPLVGGLVASERFAVTESEIVPVVAGVSGTTPFLWTPDGQNRIVGSPPPAGTAPVLVKGGTGGDRILYGSPGALHAVDATGTVVYRDSVEAAGGAAPVAGPVPSGSQGDPFSVSRVAVVFEGGLLSLHAFPTPDPAGPRTRNLGAEVLSLAAGWVGEGSGEASLVVLTADSLLVLAGGNGVPYAAWPAPDGALVSTLRLGDLDGDGLSEILLGAGDGSIFAWNGDGSPALGWPKAGVPPVQDVQILDLDGNGTLDVFALDGAGRFQGYSGRGERLLGYPRAGAVLSFLPGAVGTLDDAGGLAWVAPSPAGGLLLARRLPEAAPRAGDWRLPGARAEGGGFQPTPSGSEATPGEPDLGVPLLVYPNPVRGRGVEIRFLLEGGETASLTLLDVVGRELTDVALDPRGGFRAGENSAHWDVGGVAPGLYFCRLERDGPAGRKVDMAKILVLR